jgi:hypothetical protein
VQGFTKGGGNVTLAAENTSLSAPSTVQPRCLRFSGRGPPRSSQACRHRFATAVPAGTLWVGRR